MIPGDLRRKIRSNFYNFIRDKTGRCDRSLHRIGLRTYFKLCKKYAYEKLFILNSRVNIGKSLL